MKPTGNWVVITGASTGIGRACALHLANLGYQVAAGVRKPADESAMKLPNITPIHIDVTDAASITAAATQLKSLAGDNLRALINNAGISVVGPIEYIPIEDWRRQFEVNLFGQIAMTQAMLPLLRAHATTAGKGSPRIIMISSIAGKVAQPILAPYSASKFALEAISDSLRLELKDQGIHTILIEPGAIQSEIWRKGQQSAESIPMDHPSRSQYGFLIEQVTKRAAESANSALPAEAVARAVADALRRPTPRTRYVIGRDARIASLLKRFLPDRLWDSLIRRAFGIASPPGR